MSIALVSSCLAGIGVYLVSRSVAKSTSQSPTLQAGATGRMSERLELRLYSRAVLRVEAELERFFDSIRTEQGLCLRFKDLESPNSLATNLVEQACRSQSILLPNHIKNRLTQTQVSKIKSLASAAVHRKLAAQERLNRQLDEVEKQLAIGTPFTEADAAHLNSLTAKALERAVLQAFSRAGFQAHWCGENGHDFGADVLVSSPQRIVVQCKGWKARVGNEDVLKTVGAADLYRSDLVIILGKSGFTKSAIAAADKCECPILLFDAYSFLHWLQKQSKKKPEEIKQLESKRAQIRSLMAYISDPLRTVTDISALAVGPAAVFF